MEDGKTRERENEEEEWKMGRVEERQWVMTRGFLLGLAIARDLLSVFRSGGAICL